MYATAIPNAEFPDQYDLLTPDGVPKGTNTYTDDEFQLPDDVGETFYYVVTAVDTAGNESEPSNVKSAVLQ